jgi:hypothetical protein
MTAVMVVAAMAAAAMAAAITITRCRA